MKYRHSFHAGNFADVHKHVTLLAALEAQKRKDKGFLYLETHAGSGAYDLGDPAGGNRGPRAGLADVLAYTQGEDEIVRYAGAVREWRTAVRNGQAYPGSPVLAAGALRTQDRAVLAEIQPPEAHALERALLSVARVRVEIGDGYERLRAHLPPPERRGVLLIDPPYEDTGRDFERAAGAAAEALQKFASAVVLLWYPIKDARDTVLWRNRLARKLKVETLVSELWVHPCDSRVALNGSGLVILNPPYQVAERMREWLPALQRMLDAQGRGGSLVEVANG